MLKDIEKYIKGESEDLKEFILNDIGYNPDADNIAAMLLRTLLHSATVIRNERKSGTEWINSI